MQYRIRKFLRKIYCIVCPRVALKVYGLSSPSVEKLSSQVKERERWQVGNHNAVVARKVIT